MAGIFRIDLEGAATGRMKDAVDPSDHPALAELVFTK